MHIKCQRWRQKDDGDDAAATADNEMHVIRNSHNVYSFENILNGDFNIKT